MAWWWWRRWRRWPRRRWRTRRRRRVRTRRPRRPVRRYRSRYTVRRRRRRGWRGRRRRRLYKRRYTIRRKRKKLILKQWQPANVRKCKIRGLFPIVICGHGKSANNYALHSDDVVPMRQAFGGALSTVSFSLKVLYDQYLRHLNRWSTSNDVLDLARYLGCTFWFYRDKKTDYLVQYDISAPYKLDKDSGPSYHPGVLMQAKHKVLVPSFDTHPKGKAKVKIRIKPPKLFIDKWYSQEDLCTVNLVTFVVSLASFSHPFCPPLTNNPCVTFQVLNNFYNSVIGSSINLADTTVNTVFNNFLYSKAAFYQQVLVDSYIKEIKTNPDGSTTVAGPNDKPTANSMSSYNQWVKSSFKIPGTSVHYNFCTYKPDNQQLTCLREYYFEWETAQSTNHGFNVQHVPHAGTKPTKNWWEYRTGLFSPIFLSPYRTSPIDGWLLAYRDVSYNPLNDKGVGNRVWMQSLVKPDTQFTLPSCVFVLEDKPLWCCFYGYVDFIKSVREGQDIDFENIICIQCPYTEPPLYEKHNPNMGFVVYDSNFGNGKWLDGTGFVPVEYQCRWRPCIAFQQQVLTDITMSGPFSYKDDVKNTCIQAKYRFDFKWGGNMLYQQTIRNPCKDGQATDSHRQPRDVQVTDPLTMGPRYAFHQWDWRRGWLSDKALKRMLQKPLDFELYPVNPKRPRLFPPTEAGEGEAPKESSFSEEESEPSSQEETRPERLQLKLRQQLREQRELRVHLKHLFQQLLKTQAGLHLNPLLFNQQ
nr:MAG: ORF1 [Torque teno virus]